MPYEKSGNLENSHRTLLVSIVFTLALILRVYPSLIHGAPWGTDGWPLFKDAQGLLASTPTSFAGNSKFADQYNVYWPASIVYGAISSLVISSSPVVVMPIVFPIIAAFSTVILFAVVEQITGNTLVAFFSSIIFTASSFDSIFTASATKETFAYPLFMLGILLLVYCAKKFSYKHFALFSLISFVLATAHYALALILASLTLAVILGIFVVDLTTSPRAFDYRKWFLPVSGFLVTLVYFIAYGLPGILIPVGLGEVFFAVAFLIVSVSVSIYFTLQRNAPIIAPALIYIAGVALLIASTFIPLVPLEPLSPPSYVFDALPYLLVGFLVLLGFFSSQKFLAREQFGLLAIWLAVPLGLFGYALFGTTIGLEIVYRLFTFIYMPAAVFAGLALAQYLGGAHLGSKKIAVLAVVLIVAFLGAFQSYNAVIQGQNLLGGQWGYLPSDVSSANWAKLNSTSNMTIYGDSRINYLYDEFYGVKVSVSGGYNVLISGQSLASTPLVTDKIMMQDGYNVQLYGIPLPTNLSSTLSKYDLVYSNGNDEMWY